MSDDRKRPEGEDAQESGQESGQQSEGQVSEAGGALGDGEAAVNGADAVPDKTTGTAGHYRED